MEQQMTKDDFLQRFNRLNTQIEAAVAAQDFGRVTAIDATRRQMLQDFTASSVPAADKEFFEALERCAADNARAITEMTDQIGNLRRKAGRKVRGLSAYGPAIG